LKKDVGSVGPTYIEAGLIIEHGGLGGKCKIKNAKLKMEKQKKTTAIRPGVEKG
jgi:hypothetical protein